MQLIVVVILIIIIIIIIIIISDSDTNVYYSGELVDLVTHCGSESN